jgi:hypothetical protein
MGLISPLERRYGEGPQKGETFSVGTFTTVNAILTFVSGANVSFLASWDVWRRGVRPIELHGTLASIRVPDPDTFGSLSRSYRGKSSEASAYTARGDLDRPSEL